MFLYLIIHPITRKGYIGYTKGFRKIYPKPPFKAKPTLRIPVSAEDIPIKSEILIRNHNTHSQDGYGYNDSYQLSYNPPIPPAQTPEIKQRIRLTKEKTPRIILKMMYNKWGHMRYIPIEKVPEFIQRGWRLGILRKRKGAKRSINPIGCRRGEPGDPRRKLSSNIDTLRVSDTLADGDIP